MSRSAGRRQAVYYFPFDEFALKIGGDIVDTSNIAALAGSIREKATCRVMGKRLSKSLTPASRVQPGGGGDNM